MQQHRGYITNGLLRGEAARDIGTPRCAYPSLTEQKLMTWLATSSFGSRFRGSGAKIDALISRCHDGIRLCVRLDAEKSLVWFGVVQQGCVLDPVSNTFFNRPENGDEAFLRNGTLFNKMMRISDQEEGWGARGGGAGGGGTHDSA